MTIDKTDGMQTSTGWLCQGLDALTRFCGFAWHCLCTMCLASIILGARPSNDYVRDHANAEHMHTPVAIIGPHEACYF